MDCILIMSVKSVGGAGLAGGVWVSERVLGNSEIESR